MADLHRVNPRTRSFPSERFAALREMEDHHFWFTGRRLVLQWLDRALPPCSGRLVLDVGCGTGSLLARLTERGYRAIGLDPLGGFLPRRDAGSLLAWGDACALPIRSATCDAVVLLDVLEHTDDHLGLHEVRRVLRPGGTVIITVPANPWLWSVHDERAGHLRRYTRAELSARVREAGLDIERWQYYQCFLFPLILWSRLRARRADDLAAERQTWPLLGWITSAELFLGRWLRWPLGSTLMLLCRARANGPPERPHD